MRYLSLTCLIIVSSLSLSPLAGNAADTPPSKEELLKALTPAPAPANKAKSRSMSGSDKATFRGIQVIDSGTAMQEEKLVPPTVQLQQISFEFNSAKLTREAQLTLDNLAAAMNEANLKDSRFKLTGHTDSIGGSAFNLALSIQRAQSTQEYLVKHHHIDASRLLIEGKGFSELADPANPESAVNRRVQVTNLGKSE